MSQRNTCSIYIHDPGPRFNINAMSLEPNRSRWSDPDHSWHVAYWLHRGLLRYAHRTDDASKADVIFIAHYFLTYNYMSDPLVYGAPVLQWQHALRAGGVNALLRQEPALLRRWEQRPSDFVAAPVFQACTSSALHNVLGRARWLVPDAFLGNRCDYHDGYDAIVPLVVASAAWDPAPRTPSTSLITRDAERSQSLAPAGRRFLTHVGRLGKPYVDYPMSMLRYLMWSHLHTHPNVTFLATDAHTAVLPNLRDPRCSQPPKVWMQAGLRCCKRCSYGCQRCLEPPSVSIDLPNSLRHGVGTAHRVASKASYRAALAASSLCLVLRGDTESTRKLSEAMLAGCVPVLIADMPAWPFARRLDYSKFSFEFDWRAASADPGRVVDTLLRVPRADIETKRREVLRVRDLFFFHDHPSRPGAVSQLIAELCSARHALPPRNPAVGRSSPSQNVSALYDSRPKRMTVARFLSHRVGRGAQRGSLHHVLVRPAYADGVESDRFVPAEPFRGAAVLAAYLRTPQGQRLARYIN